MRKMNNEKGMNSAKWGSGVMSRVKLGGAAGSMKLGRGSVAAYATGGGLAVLLAAFLVCSVVAPAERANADTMAYKDATTGYVTSVQSSDNLTLQMTTLPKANLAKISDTVVTKTNNPNGYQLYFSMDRVSDYANNRPGNALYMDNNPTSSNFIPSTTNTFAAPGDLAANTWGFSLDNGASFSAIPLRNSAVKVAENTSATSAAGDSLAVTYGVSANNALPDGTYSGRIVYNVVSETSATDIDRMMLSPSEVEPGDTLTIRTSLYTTHTFATTDISVKIATSESGTASTGNTCEVTSVSTADGMLSLECTVPDFDVDPATYNLPIEVSVSSYGKTYTGTIAVKVTTIPVSCSANTICYAPNAKDVEGKMGTNGKVTSADTDQIGRQTQIYLDYDDTSMNTGTITTSTAEFTLFPPNYTRPGYGFAGWSTEKQGDSTNTYGPNQTLVGSNSTQASTAGVTWTDAMKAAFSSDKGLIFYAQWVKAEENTDLQSWTGCSSMNNGDVTALNDSRDSNTYAVAKLADNKCWMIENFRYSGSGTQTTSFSTTNPGSQQYSLTNIDRTKDPLAVSSQGSPYYQWYSYGGQYSWLSAINSSSNPSSGDVSTSICPTGWKLPTGGSSGQFQALNNAISGDTTFTGSNALRKYPNNFVFAGRWNGASAYYRGTYGYYWSSSVYTSNYAHGLGFYSTNVYPADNYDKRRGYSVRCVYSS